MPIIKVNLIDTFDQWRIKTNNISNNFGDLSLLTTTENSNVVSAVNELKGIVDQYEASNKSVAEDTSPELGGDLDLNSKNIIGTGNINITGTITGTINLGGGLTGTVDNAQVATDSITTNKLADDAVSTSKLFNNAVTTIKIADDAVTSDKIADNSITSTHIAPGVVVETDVADNAITSDKIADDAVGISELNVSGSGTNGQALVTDGSGGLSWADVTSDPTMGGSLAGTASNAQLADNAVQTENIVDQSITVAKLATSGTLPALDGSQLTGIVTVPQGLIAMWSGNTANIPSGWVLCDGNNSTPDLRDKFIIGAGSTYNVSDTGGSTETGAHTLTIAEMPTHSHPNVHTSAGWNATHGDNGGMASTWGSTGDAGGNGAHSHTGNLPPYYALAYIMKT